MLCSGDGKLLQARERCWDRVRDGGNGESTSAHEEKFPLNEIICYIFPPLSLSHLHTNTHAPPLHRPLPIPPQRLSRSFHHFQTTIKQPAGMSWIIHRTKSRSVLEGTKEGA